MSKTTISQSPDTSCALSDEDLLSVLLLRQRAQQEKRDALKAAEAAKDQEIGDLRDVSHNLYQQLLSLQEQDRNKEAEISRLHSILPQLRKRIQGLTRDLDTLAEDHRDLMRSSKELHKEQIDARTEKIELALMLKNVHETIESDHRRHSATKALLVEARHHIEMLEQTIEDQGKQSREADNLLHAERDRSQRVEAEMTKLTSSYHELTNVVMGHPDMILEKMSKVLETSLQSADTTQTKSQLELKSLLDQCVELLKKLHTVEAVKPQDLEKLDNSVRTYAQR